MVVLMRCYLKEIYQKILKKCLRKGNWKPTTEYVSGRGGRWVEYSIEMKINKANIQNVFNNNVNVSNKYPTKYGVYILGEFIQIGKYKLKLTGLKTWK
jgi:hypothetical protein